MSVAIDLSGVAPEKRDAVRALFEIDADGPGWDDDLEHVPGTAVPIDDPLPVALEDLGGDP